MIRNLMDRDSVNILPRNVVIFGAGGLGREVLWAVGHPDSKVLDKQGSEYRPNVIGFLDSNVNLHGKLIGGTRVLGGPERLESMDDALVIVAVGLPFARIQAVKSLRDQHTDFATLISPQSIVGDYFCVGEGSVVLPGAVVTTDVHLGDFVLLNPTTSVSHDCFVDSYTSIAPGASLAGNVRIGSACEIGTNASVIPGTTIGPHTIVGAGACVTRDISGYVTVVGVPARPIGASRP